MQIIFIGLHMNANPYPIFSKTQSNYCKISSADI